MRGKTAVFKSLNIEANEITPVLLLIAQSVFLGIFYGTFDIGAHTLFLKTYPEDMIPKAYVLSGFVGILLTSLYSKLQSKVKFSKLSIFTLLFIAVSTLLMRLSFEFTTANWTVFVVFLLFGPLNILAFYLAFWGTVSRIFNLRQGKRLFGIIDTGQVFGIILSSYAIPFILTYLNGTKNLLLLSGISVVFAVIIELIIARKYNLDNTESKEDVPTENTQESESEVKIQHFIKDNYILYMALFVVFSMFAAFFIQYSFLVVTNEQYPVEEDLAKYLAFFTGSMMAFTLIIKTFVYSKLMKTYGLKVSLILSPLLLGLFTGIAIVVGWISGFEPGSTGFIYFFLFISLSKLFNKTLKDALEVPSFKLLYQSLKKSIRFDVQAKIDGTINEIAALTSGILLSVLGILAFIKLIHFSIFLFALLILWTLITIKLYKEYRYSLEKSLSGSSKEKELKNTRASTTISNLPFNPDDRLKLNLKYRYSPGTFRSEFKMYVGKFEQIDITQLNNGFFVELYLLVLKKEFTDELIKNIQSQIRLTSEKNFSTYELSELLNSKNKNDIASAIHYLYALDHKSRLTQLWALLRVPIVHAQQYTMRMCGEFNESETINTLVEFLESDSLFSFAVISLKQLAIEHAKLIIQTFYKSDIPLLSQLAIIESVSEAPDEITFDFFIENLSNQRKEIFEKTIAILKNKNIDISEEYQPKLFHPITVAAKTMAWDISALASISSKNENSILYFVINHEYKKHEALLIDLLAIAYDKQSVIHVQEHLNSGTSEGVGYALELFDLFISEEIKPMILAIFEDKSLGDKSRLLEAFFPIEISNEKNLILNILNRNPNLISATTKQVALSYYLEYFNEITEDLIAQVFNPVEVLQTSAASIINQIDKNKLNKIKPRLPVHDRYTIDTELKASNNKQLLIDYFYQNPEPAIKLHLNETQLLDIADNLTMKHLEIRKKESIDSIVNNYFVFLDSDQIINSANKSKQEPYLPEMNNYREISQIDFLIGLKKSKMNKIAMLDIDFIQNLINTV